MKSLRNILSHQLVWAFNINDLIEVKAITKAAGNCNKPIVMLISSNAIKYAGLDYLGEIIKVAKRTSKIPLFVQLDHGKDESLIMDCAKRGFDAIMVDASNMDYEDNIKFVKKLIKRIRKINRDILIEAELGVIGDSNNNSQTTNLEQIQNFVQETDIDLLAVSVGNKHGFSKKKPSLDERLLKSIGAQTKVPLVLHGGDWISQKDIRIAARNGVKKINIGPELRLRVGELIRDFANSKEFDIMDHRKVMNIIIDDLAVKISEKLKIVD